MKFNLEIESVEDPAELARILARLGEHVAAFGYPSGSGVIRDVNGTLVGDWSLDGDA